MTAGPSTCHSRPGLCAEVAGRRSGPAWEPGGVYSHGAKWLGRRRPSRLDTGSERRDWGQLVQDAGDGNLTFWFDSTYSGAQFDASLTSFIKKKKKTCRRKCNPTINTGNFTDSIFCIASNTIPRCSNIIKVANIKTTDLKY